MPEIPWSQIREIAARLGHTDLRIVQMRDGFYRAECSCGLRTARQAREVESVKQAVYHFDQVVSGAWERAKFPGGPSPREIMERDRRALEGTRRARAERRKNAPTRDTPTHSPDSILSPDSVRSASL